MRLLIRTIQQNTIQQKSIKWLIKNTRYLCVFLSCLLSACSHIYGEEGLIKSKKFEYLDAKEGRSLKYPKGISNKSQSDFAHIPLVKSSKKSSLFGKQIHSEAPTQILAVFENTRVDSRSKIPAIFIMDETSFVWKSIQEFLTHYKISAQVQHKKNKAIIQTKWVEMNEDGEWLDISQEDVSTRSQYTFNLLKTRHPNEIKLLIKQNHLQERQDETTAWKTMNTEWVNSTEMMNLFLNYYDKKVQIRHYQHQQKMMAGFPIQLIKNNKKSPYLLAEANHTLVWQKVPKVMKTLGFILIDSDKRKKTYFFEFKEKESGFFASLFEDKRPPSPISSGTYQVFIEDMKKKQRIVIKDDQGKSLNEELLTQLYPDLKRLFGNKG
jgi:uncharacterized lipoprotein